MEGRVRAVKRHEFGSGWAQFKIRTYLYDNSRVFTLGDRYEANGWAAYKFNESFSVSAGARWEKWGNIDGDDRGLAAISTRDPHTSGVFLSGLRASLPLGINFLMPEGSRLAGHRISFETVYALHHDYVGPQLGLDWGISLGWVAAF